MPQQLVPGLAQSTYKPEGLGYGIGHQYILCRNLEKDQNFFHVVKNDNFQTVCLYIKKPKNCFSQSKKKNSDTLIEKEQI